MALVRRHGLAAVVLLLGAAASGQSLLRLPGDAYFWIFMSALVPQAIGHTLLNWSLAHVSATKVTLAVRAEPVLATLLAIPVLGEVPAWTVVLGGALLLVFLPVSIAFVRNQPEEFGLEPDGGTGPQPVCYIVINIVTCLILCFFQTK